jgi:uncharacterized YccA/Bax inhibitor family protein
MRTANPALNSKTFTTFAPGESRSSAMTLNGTVTKTALLLVFLVVPAGYTWNLLNTSPNPNAVYPWMIGGAIGGFILALITIFKKTAAPVTAPLYAIAEGLFLGGLSALFERSYPGIVSQAVCLTFGTLFALLAAYRSGLIKVTENFKLGIVAATGAIALVYMVSFVMSIFGFGGFGFIHDSGPIGIGFSLVVVVIAALNLVLDFDFIESGVEQGAPKYMEWYAAFGLLVSLVWLYIELLRLLSKLRSR